MYKEAFWLEIKSTLAGGTVTVLPVVEKAAKFS